MSNYNDNWKAFVNETKEMGDEQLQEYVGDIARAVSGLFNQSGEGDKYSGLSTVRPKAAPVDVSKLLNATSLKDYAAEYNRLVDADERENIREINPTAVNMVLAFISAGDTPAEIVQALRTSTKIGPFSAFGNEKTLENFVDLVAQAHRRGVRKFKPRKS
jgi:hypothetical protein